jgi:hypothetical protein
MRRNSSLTDLARREQEVVTFLDAWPWDWGGCIIGGYAVASYGLPRFSQDVDLVIPRDTKPKIVEWLDEAGFRSPPRDSRSFIHFDDVIRLTRGDVILDLMVGRVRDREVGAELPEPWISKKSNRTILELVRARTTSPVAIARPEAIWALKLLSARDQDLGDLYAISRTKIQEADIAAILSSVMNAKLRVQLEELASRLQSPKIYFDSLSRVQGGSPRDQRNLESWRSFTALVDRLVLASTSETGDS